MKYKLEAINAYIRQFCTCDGMGPLDSMSDMGNFEGLTTRDLVIIEKNLKGE